MVFQHFLSFGYAPNFWWVETVKTSQFFKLQWPLWKYLHPPLLIADCIFYTHIYIYIHIYIYTRILGLAFHKAPADQSRSTFFVTVTCSNLPKAIAEVFSRIDHKFDLMWLGTENRTVSCEHLRVDGSINVCQQWRCQNCLIYIFLAKTFDLQSLRLRFFLAESVQSLMYATLEFSMLRQKEMVGFEIVVIPLYPQCLYRA